MASSAEHIQGVVFRGAKFVSRLVIFLVALLVLLGIVAITLTQYGPTRQLGVEMGLDALNESIDGNVTVGSVNGDLLTGLELRDVTLAAPDGEFARVPRILLRYDPVGILQQKEVVATLLIDNPEVSLIRSSDGLWNIDAFIGPQPESPPEPRSRLDWIFDVSSVEIRDGRLSVRDYSRISRPVTGDPASSPIAFDPLDAEFDGIFLEAATYFSEERQSLLIRRLGFREQKSDLRLLDIVGRIDLDGNDGLRIDDLIVETEGSYLELSGRFDTPGLFDTTFASALPLANMSVDLRAERVSTDELGRLIPATTFLAGDPALTLSASGNLDSLLVEKLDLTVGDSRLNLTGTLDDLSDPDRWSIEAEISESSLRLADVRATLPEIDFSSVGFVEHVDIERLTYSGTPQDLTTTFDLATNVGSLYGGGVLGFGNGGVWRADASANELDLDAVSSGSLTGDVNGRFVAEGTGFSLEDLTARLRARLTSSRIAGREVSGAWIDGSFGEGGLVTVDTAVIGFGGGSSAGIDRPDLDELAESLDNVRVRTDLAVLTDGFVLGSAVDDAFASNPSVRLSGWLRTGENPSYRAFVETDRFNAADVTLDQNHNSRLGFVAEIEGEGFELDDIEARLHVDASDVLLPDGTDLGPFRIDSLVVAMQDGERRLSLESDVADLEVIGEWRFSTLLPTLSTGFEKLIDYVARKSAYRSEDLELLTEDLDISGIPESIYATYRIVPKDLRIVESFVPNLDLEFVGELSGNITGTTDLLALSALGRIDRLRYGTGPSAIAADSVLVDVDIRNISSGAMDDLLSADIAVKSSQPYRIGGGRYRVPNVNVAFDDGRLTFSGGGTIDEKYTTTVAGSLDVLADKGYAIVLDTVAFSMGGGRAWSSVGPSRFLANSDGIEIENLAIERAGAEKVTVTGRFDQYKRFDGVRIDVSSLPIRELGPLLPVLDSERMFETLDGNLDSASVQLEGTLEAPEITLSILLSELAYSGVSVGTIRTNARYANKDFSGTLRVEGGSFDTLDAPELLADIDIRSIPIDLAFAPREDRFSSGKPFDIVGTTNKLPLAILGPFVPGILIRGGDATLGFNVDGRYPDVDYRGRGQIDDGLIIVESTNIAYTLNASFSLAEERLDIAGATLGNVPSDLPRGRATAYGSIYFDGFTPDLFDISIRTDGLLVLSDATEAVNDRYYGDLIVATETGRTLKFGGSLDYPMLKGAIVILESDLTYPYRDQLGEYSGRVEFVEYEQWKKKKKVPIRPTLPEIPDSVRRKLGIDHDSIGPPEGGVPEERGSAEVAGTFMDRLDIQIAIRIPKSAGLNIEIGPVQNLDLLVNNGDEPLFFTMLGDAMTLRGSVNLLERSRFSFVKTFDAVGSVQFLGDILDPEFQITGEYAGRRTFSGETQRYTVLVGLAGSLALPEISFSYAIEGVAADEDQVQNQADALLLLLLGRRQSELFGGTEGAGGVQAREVLGGGIDAVASNPIGAILSSLFSDIEGLQEVEFDANVEDPGRTRVSLLYELGEILLRYDGRVTELSDGTVTVEVPLGLLLDAERLRNFSLELQRDVLDEFDGGFGGSGASTSDDELYRLRLSLRWTW